MNEPEVEEMKKKIMTGILAALMVTSMAACSWNRHTEPTLDGNDYSDGSGVESFDFVGGAAVEDGIELGTPEVALDPQAIYKNLTYVPQMFYGAHELRGGLEASARYGVEADYFTYISKGETMELSTFPIAVEAGKHTMSHMVTGIEGYDWMSLQFMRKYIQLDGELSYYLSDRFYCAYHVEGNKLILQPLESYRYDKSTKKIHYAFSDVTWEYTFSFTGRSLTLSAGGDSITLQTGLDSQGVDDYLYVGHYLSAGSESVAGIDRISFRTAAGSEERNRLYLEMKDGTTIENAVVRMGENGLFTVTIPNAGGTQTYQYVYFYSYQDGLTLTDGVNTYFYNDHYTDRNKSTLTGYLSEDETGKLEDLTEEELEEVVEKTENLLEDLAQAYRQAGLKVSVNTKTGEIAADSTVLFGVNEATISNDGKAFLRKFMAVYTQVVFDEKYEGFVSRILVEGHTDTSGSYELNQALSQERADNIRAYCLSADCGIDSSYSAALQTMLEAKGYAYDKPVYDENGEVDMDASRRVSFRFLINLG